MGDEAPILRDCLSWFRSSGIFAWRCSLGGLRTGKGARRKNPMSGFPDAAFIVPNSGGRFGVVECKAPKGKLEPHQIEWRDRLVEQGVFYVLATSLDDLIAAFDQIPNRTHLGTLNLEHTK